MPRKIDASDSADRLVPQESTTVSSPLDTIRSWLRSSIARSPSSPRGRRQQRTLSMERLDERSMMAGDLGHLPEEPAGYISYEQGEGEGSDSAPSDALNAALTDQALLQMMLDEEHSKELLVNRSWGTSLMIDSQNVTSAGVAPSGDLLAVGKSDGTVAFYTAGTGVEQAEKALNLGAPITSLKYLTGGNLLVTTAKSFRVIDASGATVKTVNYTQDISKMNTLDNGFFVFVYASAGLPSSVMLYDQKGEQTYKKDISPNVGVVSVTNDGSTMIHGYPSGASAIPITAQGKGIGLDFYSYMGRGSGTVGSAELNADGTGRFMFAYQTDRGAKLVVTDATGKTLVRDYYLGEWTSVQNIVSLGGGRFMVDTLQDVTADAGRSRQTRIFKYELGVLKEETPATKQGGYKYSPLSVSADMTTAITSQYDSVIVGSLPSAVADTKALQDGAKKIGPAVINNAQLDNSLGKNLVNGQRSDLVGLAQTFSTLTTLKYNNVMIFDRFLATFADWRDENAVATAKAKNWSLDYFYYARGQEFESFNKDIGSYDDALGRMMEAGMNAVLADIRFQDPSSALTSLRAIPTDPIYGSTLAHMAQIGIKLPTEAQIISACKAILVNGSEAYQDMQGIYLGRTANAIEKFNSNSYAGTAPATPPVVPPITSDFDRKAWESAMKVAKWESDVYLASIAKPQPAEKPIAKDGDISSTIRVAAENLLKDVGGVVTHEQGLFDPVSASHGAAQMRETQLKSLSSAVNLNKIGSANPVNKPVNLSLDRTSVATVRFTLTEKMMVNLTIDTPTSITDQSLWKNPLSQGPLIRPNLSLTLSGVTKNKERFSWTSGKSIESAESISVALDPGDYLVEVNDSNGISALAESIKANLPSKVLSVPLNVGINKFDSRKIEGKVSIEGSPESMPVAMSVAEYDTNGDRRASDKVSALNPNLPVWVTVHGRTDNEKSGKMEDLTKALTEYAKYQAKGAQVLTIDWTEAAKSFNSINPDTWDLSDVRWTEQIGTWIARQLISAGVPPTNVSGFFHSHGNGIGYYVSKELNRIAGTNMNLFVALDPAKNPALAGGNAIYNAVNAHQYSAHSIAFDSSWFGASSIAGTADEAYVIQTATNDVDPASNFIDDTILKHGGSVSAFASMVREGMKASPNIFGQYFKLGNLLSGTNVLHAKPNVLAGDEQPLGEKVYEGEIVTTTQVLVDAQGAKWLKASPKTLQYQDNTTNVLTRESTTESPLQDHDGKALVVGSIDQNWIGDINPENNYNFSTNNNRMTRLLFTLPKTDSKLLIKVENMNPAPQELPYYFAIDSATPSCSLQTNAGNYKITVKQELPSQSFGVLDVPVYADMPYTLTIQ